VDNCGKLWENCQYLWKTKMFIGEYQHSIDIKKRLSLPAKFRKELGSRVIVTRGFENCLVIYTKQRWEKVMEQLENLSTGRAETRKFTRAVLGGAVEVSLDKLGRVLLPDYLKEYAGLKKDVIICGLSNKLEVWDSEKWETYRKKAELDIDKVAENLPELGI
jgi:transcriptional regulator MraZ